MNDEELEEEALKYGLEEDYFGTFKKKIDNTKKNKGHAFLVTFNKDNEEKRIDKFIKALKLGLRISIVSDWELLLFLIQGID